MTRLSSPSRPSQLRPEWLLRHAEQLTERVSATDEPRSVHPRRAISAAYYAAFHATGQAVAETAMPDIDEAARRRMCRGFEHAGLGVVASWLRGSRCPTSIGGIVEQARASAALVEFARQIVDLRSEREWADYSHEVVVDRESAEAMTAQSRSAIVALATAQREDPSAWQAFVALMVMMVKPRTYELPDADILA